jgi:hypothetical protein
LPFVWGFHRLSLILVPVSIFRVQVWEEEVRFIDMHPNPVVLERLFAVGQLAVSNERVLLSGLPVHVLVSVENPKSEMKLKGHFRVEPGQAHDIWVDLVDASGKRLVSPNGKGASLLVNLLYEPMHNSLRLVFEW